MTQNIQDMILEVYQVDPWCQGLHCPPSLLSGTLIVLQVPPWRTPHSWHTSNEDFNMKLSGYEPWGQPSTYMMPRVTLSSKSPVRNHQCPPSNPIKDPHSWHSSNEDSDTKLSEYDPLGLRSTSMASRMILSSKFPVRNPQHPPSTSLKNPPFLTHF